MELPSELLKILVCPVSKQQLEYNRQTQELISEKAGLAYPVRDGIPILLPDEARKINKNAFKPIIGKADYISSVESLKDKVDKETV